MPHRQAEKFLKKPKKLLDIWSIPCYYMQALKSAYAPIAQLDRVTDYESVGRGFESLSAYQKNRYPIRDSGFSYFMTVQKQLPVSRKEAGSRFYSRYRQIGSSSRMQTPKVVMPH